MCSITSSGNWPSDKRDIGEEGIDEKGDIEKRFFMHNARSEIMAKEECGGVRSVRQCDSGLADKLDSWTNEGVVAHFPNCIIVHAMIRLAKNR